MKKTPLSLITKQSGINTPLLRWLTCPTSWTLPQKLALSIFVCIAATIVAARTNTLFAEIPAIMVFFNIGWLSAIVVWRRLFKHE